MSIGKTIYIPNAVESRQKRIVITEEKRSLIRTSCTIVTLPLLRYTVNEYRERGYTVRSIAETGDGRFSIDATKKISKIIIKPKTKEKEND